MASSYLAGSLIAFAAYPPFRAMASAGWSQVAGPGAAQVLSAETPKPTSTPSPTASPTEAKKAASATAGGSIRPSIATAPAVATSRVGMAGGSALTALSSAQLGAQLDGIKALGAGWVRFDFQWDNIEPSPGQFNWGATDRVVQAANARGLKTVGIIDYTPGWARAAGCGSFACKPANAGQYGTFAATVAARYKGVGLHSWEIWNEPNSPVYFQPGADPAAYTALLKAAYNSIKAVDSSATIITGGLAPGDTGGGWYSPPDFANGIYANGAKGYFTAFGDHPYTYPVTAMYYNPGNAWSQMTTIRNTMAANGDAGKQIWITEYGSPTGGPGSTACANNYSVAAAHVCESLQAQTVTDFFNAAGHLPWVGPVFWYSYQDAGNTQDTNENFFGLVRYDGSHKPAYANFVTAAHSSPWR